MLSQEIEEKLTERLANRIEEVNSNILKKIGEAIKKISTLTPSQAYQVSQILKYRRKLRRNSERISKSKWKECTRHI